MLGLSLGDIVVIVFGVVGIGTWVVERLLHGSERSGDKRGGMWDRINALDKAIGAHDATDRVEFQWIKEELIKVNRKLDNVQAQLRNVATNSHDRASRMEDPK